MISKKNTFGNLDIGFNMIQQETIYIYIDRIRAGNKGDIHQFIPHEQPGLAVRWLDLDIWEYLAVERLSSWGVCVPMVGKFAGNNHQI